MTDFFVPDERPTCGAPTRTPGHLCAITFGLSPANGRCLIHDPDRAAAVRASRVRGGERRHRGRARGPAIPDLRLRLDRIEAALARIERHVRA